MAGAGVWLALRSLVQSGLLRIARKLYGGIEPACCGLRAALVTLYRMALLRVQRPEQLKERALGGFWPVLTCARGENPALKHCGRTGPASSGHARDHRLLDQR